jgi:hypothetical protein
MRNWKIFDWIKFSAIIIPIISGSVYIGRSLAQTKENTKDIDAIEKKLSQQDIETRNLYLMVQRNIWIDSVMFVNQARIMKKMGLE